MTSEQLEALQKDVALLKRFKFSGYIQGRYEITEDSADTVRVDTGGNITPANRERFYIRRARLKLTYTASPLSHGVVYFDGGQDRVARLLEAYVTIRDPWTDKHLHALTVGQMNVPFGYEVERSSGSRELPERSRAENVLFPGERDRGLKIVSSWTPRIETVVGLLNGGGINDPRFPSSDPTRAKDLVGRIRWSQKEFDAAVSGYDGKETTPLIGPDHESDKTRIGADAQIRYGVPSLGKGTVLAEGYWGKDLNADSLKALVSSNLPVAGADLSHLSTDFQGGYVMVLQHVNRQTQIALRWDWFDPNTDLDHDQYTRLSAGINYFYDDQTRITVSYDAPDTDKPKGGGFADPEDNVWTFQLQYKF